jgi:hypothetical protein
MEWINIKDALPEYGIPVLTTDGDNLFWVSERWVSKEKNTKEYFKSVICTCCDMDYDDAKIKYWSYIPFQPERLNPEDHSEQMLDMICDSPNTPTKGSESTRNE